MTVSLALLPDYGNDEDSSLFAAIADNIAERGYAVHPFALPAALTEALWQHVQSMSPEQFRRAAIGREKSQLINDFVRTDEVCWINGESEAGCAWLAWIDRLQHFLNRRLFLGLFSFESHFAHYQPGDFYKMHLDAFKGEANRILSLVVYLNPGWQPEDGGELMIQVGDRPQETIKVTPSFGTLVAFLSEDFPHEVLPASRDRYSIAGWFRLNTSCSGRVDPPL